MKKARGSIHIMTAIILFLAAIGGWHIYKGYQDQKFNQSPPALLMNYERWAMTITTDIRDRQELQQAFDRIRQITARYSQQSHTKQQ